MERLQKQYTKEIAPAMAKEFGYKSTMQVPRITKIVINVGVGKIAKDAKFIDTVASELAVITGQAPVKTKARKSIAGFKVRENQIVGVAVTLRGQKMWSFLDKLVNVALPRVKDFRGISPTGFDGRGNYHLGLKEHVVFPEITNESLENIFGLQVGIITTAKTDAEAKALLSKFNFPFKQDKN